MNEIAGKAGISNYEIDIIDGVLDYYGKFTPETLRDKTHQEEPWIEARKGYKENEFCKEVISKETMKEYFTGIKETSANPLRNVFHPEIIKFDGRKFILSRSLECNVKKHEDTVYINCEELDINVWGETRKEAKEAFSFSFMALYDNFYNEDDYILSDNAIELKKLLHELVNYAI